MTNLNNVNMTLNANNPEEEMKMTNVNNMVNGVAVEGLNKEEKMMIELNEKREMLIAAIEEELMNEVVDMVVVGDYEEILAGVEYEIIELLNSHEEQVLEEEYKMEKAVELDKFVDEITPVEKITTKVGFYEEGLDKEYGRETEINYRTNAELIFCGEEIVSVRPYRLVDKEIGGDTVKIYAESFNVDANKLGETFTYSLYETEEVSLMNNNTRNMIKHTRDLDSLFSKHRNSGVEMGLYPMLHPIKKEKKKIEEEQKIQAIERMIEEVGVENLKIEEEQKMQAIERMIEEVEVENLKIEEEQKMKNVKITQDELKKYKDKYQQSTERTKEYVDVLIGHESYHAQLEYNLIAPALATYVEEPEGLSREQASYLLEEESKKQDVIISYVSRALGLSREAVEKFMNE